MSRRSLDRLDEEESSVADEGYKGYHIDQRGEVTEFYDHRNDSAPPSTVGSRQPIVNGNNTVTAPSQAPTHHVNHGRRVRYRDAGCCDSCVNCLTTIGTMPLATVIAMLFSLLGTALFIGAGWTALDETLTLFQRYGPVDGNPATDAAPEYIFLPGSAALTVNNYILRDVNNLGNRVPQVFQSIKYAFYGIIPFMLIFTFLLGFNTRRSTQTLMAKGRKPNSTSICFTAGLIACTYILILGWIFFLAFTTLGVYYYRITMLRCDDLNNRGYTEGVFGSICIDLVQLGLIMFQNTNDEGFGKICGPGDNMRSFGKLKEYCENYYSVYQFMLIAFAGCLLVIIAMINFIMILTSSYNKLTMKRYRPVRSTPPSVVTQSRSPPAPIQAPPSRAVSQPPPYVVGTRSEPDSSKRGYGGRRSSRDIELDYLMPESESSYNPRREDDSQMGVNYYYKH